MWQHCLVWGAEGMSRATAQPHCPVHHSWWLAMDCRVPVRDGRMLSACIPMGIYRGALPSLSPSSLPPRSPPPFCRAPKGALGLLCELQLK